MWEERQGGFNAKVKRDKKFASGKTFMSTIRHPNPKSPDIQHSQLLALQSENNRLRQELLQAEILVSALIPCDDNNHDNGSKDCMVCLESYSQQRKPLVLLCGHSICSICRKGWKTHCPKCRAPDARETINTCIDLL